MTHESLIGHLLIAVPELMDQNFNQSVVLLIQHDREGASGLILNRISDTTIADVFAEETPPPTADQLVHIGGPVEGPVMAIHGCVSLGEKDVLENVYFSMKRENLRAVVDQTLRPFRLFSGYSGWGPNQLEAELAVGGWLVATASAELVFCDQENLWKNVCDQVGMEIIFSKTRATQRSDPSFN